MPTRPIRIEGDTAYIPLTKGYEAIIDAADVPLVEGSSWCADANRRTVYALRTERIDGRKLNVRLHRVLVAVPDGLVIDHIDGNGLNNRRSNLRLATVAQNTRNKKRPANNTSGYKGVSWDKTSGKWRAIIRAGASLRYLGYYSTSEDAYAAYCKASAEMHGEFGRVA